MLENGRIYWLRAIIATAIIRLQCFCCFSSTTGIRHIKISRQVRITSSRIRTHIIFTSHNEMAKVMRMTAIARGFAPWQHGPVFLPVAQIAQTTSDTAASDEKRGDELGKNTSCQQNKRRRGQKWQNHAQGA